jgi:hypothetical protein
MMERDAHSRMQTLVFRRPGSEREVTVNIRLPDAVVQCQPTAHAPPQSRSRVRSGAHMEFQIEVPAHLALDFGVATEDGWRDHKITCQRSPHVQHPGMRRGRWISHVVTQYAAAGTVVPRPPWRR